LEEVQGGVELLIVVGVDLNTMNDFHKTPLDYAKVESWAHPEVKAVKRQNRRPPPQTRRQDG